MFKNVAAQKIALLALDSATGRPKTGDAANITGYVSKDFGAPAALGTAAPTEISSTNAPGWYLFTLTQAETNGDGLLFTAKSTTSGVDIVGNLIYTLPPNFSSIAIDSNGNVKVQTGLKKSQGLNNYEFVMTDSTTHNPIPGKTVTVTRSLDGGAFVAGTIGAVTEVSDGVYKVDLPAADLNGSVVTLRMTASGCDTLFVALILTP